MVKETFAEWADEVRFADSAEARSPPTAAQPPSAPADPSAAAAACRRGGRQPAGRERPSARGRAAAGLREVTIDGTLRRGLRGRSVRDPFRDIGPLPVETTEAERPAHLRVAPDSVELLRRRRRARLIVVLGAAISAASMFLLVAFHVFAVQSSFQLDKLQTQLTAEQRRYGSCATRSPRARRPRRSSTRRRGARHGAARSGLRAPRTDREADRRPRRTSRPVRPAVPRHWPRPVEVRRPSRGARSDPRSVPAAAARGSRRGRAPRAGSAAPPRRKQPRATPVAAHPGRRLVACSVLVLLVFSAFAVRVAQLQVFSGDRYKRLAARADDAHRADSRGARHDLRPQRPRPRVVGSS